MFLIIQKFGERNFEKIVEKEYLKIFDYMYFQRISKQIWTFAKNVFGKVGGKFWGRLEKKMLSNIGNFIKFMENVREIYGWLELKYFEDILDKCGKNF